MDDAIRDLVEEAHTIFKRYVAHNQVLSQSIPVLYFGDLESYRSSSLRVVTVGSNPSYREFRDNNGNPTDDPFWRFSGIGPAGTYTEEEYKSALDGYFKGGTDYEDWFQYYNRVLEGLGASYYDDAAPTTLHTDLHSPLATSAQWSEIEDKAPDLRQNLRGEGIPLWHRLIRTLQPDLIIASIRRGGRINHVHDIGFDKIGDEKVIKRLDQTASGEPRKEAYEVTAWPVQIGKKKATVVHGPKNINPFMIGKETQAEEVGRAIHDYIQD